MNIGGLKSTVVNDGFLNKVGFTWTKGMRKL